MADVPSAAADDPHAPDRLQGAFIGGAEHGPMAGSFRAQNEELRQGVLSGGIKGREWVACWVRGISPAAATEAPTSSGPPCTDALLQLHSADRHRPLALALEAPLREAVHRWHTAKPRPGQRLWYSARWREKK